MSSWFSKVFQQTAEEAAGTPSAPAARPSFEVEEEFPAPRRVVNAPVLAEAEVPPADADTIRIKATADTYGTTITFLVDRPVLENLSFWVPDVASAYTHSPLASALFDEGGVESVLIHHMTVKVQRERGPESWEDHAARLGEQIRAHLKSGLPVVAPDTLDRMPSPEEIREALQQVIDEEINPGIAAHSGLITLNRVEGNTAYITMGGGCQGCAASSITLRGGVEKAFRDACPFVGAILDETDHTAGQNPFFSSLPAGMGM